MKSDGYLPQVDGLRTLAVAGVIVAHYGIGGSLPWGHLGVRLFFVISGYLITGILVGSREEVAAGRQTVPGALGVFYARRFLRIFPLYYAVLAGSLLLHRLPARIAPWFFLYGSNILFARDGAWGPLAHFWSLAVEEQFYLAWPLLVLLIPRRALGWCLGAMVAGSVVWRLAVQLAGANGMWSDILLPACLDSLALGALLAHAESSAPLERVRRWSRITFLAGAGVTVAAFLDAARLALFDLGTSLLFMCLVFRARLGLRDPLGRFVESRPVVYVGKISYGVYVFHAFGWNLAGRLATGAPRVILGIACTLAMAALSWRFYEGPLNRLKRHFAYRRSPPDPRVRRAGGVALTAKVDGSPGARA